MRVFKAFDIYGGKLTSIGTLYPHELTYDPGEVKQHPNIFVFGSEEAARAWLTSPLRAALWECETTQTRAAPMLILKVWHLSSFFERYWEVAQLGGFPGWMVDMLQSPPEGTLLVDDLKLIRPLAL